MYSPAGSPGVPAPDAGRSAGPAAPAPRPAGPAEGLFRCHRRTLPTAAPVRSPAAAVPPRQAPGRPARSGAGTRPFLRPYRPFRHPRLRPPRLPAPPQPPPGPPGRPHSCRWRSPRPCGHCAGRSPGSEGRCSPPLPARPGTGHNCSERPRRRYKRW